MRPPPILPAMVVFIRGQVVELLERWRDGTIAIVKDKQEEYQVFLPTWRVAKGDRVEGEFVPGHRFLVPRKGHPPRILPGKAQSLERELGQAILNTVPQLGYRRAQALAAKGMEAFDYLLLHKDLKDLFYIAETRLLEEVTEALFNWRWFFVALKELIQIGFTPLEAADALEFLGAPALEIAKEDPFLLCITPGVSYTTLAARLHRTSATGALLDEIGIWMNAYGDTLVPLHHLPMANEDLDAALKHPKLPTVLYLADRYASPRPVWEKELTIYEALAERSELPELTPPTDGPNLEPQQREAFALTKHRIAILTGGPGTGKTFTLSRLVQAARKQGIPVQLMAPTGKAAQRMAELSGMEATTVHRALGIDPNTPFASPKPLTRGLVIMDESSMADLALLASVVEALPPGAALLLVGDANQLPPVSPGAPFSDLVDLAPTARLTRVKRQAAHSLITEVATKLLEGQPLEELVPPGQSEVLLRTSEDLDALAEAIVETAVWYAHNGKSIANVQVLTPIHAGPLGTRRLNERIRAGILESETKKRRALNLGDGSVAYVGDKIIFGENRPQFHLMNGTMGIITHISDTEFLLDTGNDAMSLPRYAARWAQLGYAVTVHRAQGSEWDVTILALPESPITRRKLIYTGITRGKRQVVAYAIPKIASQPVPLERARVTYLRYLRHKEKTDAPSA